MPHNHTVTRLARWLHQTPRVDFELRPVTSDFLVDDSQYEQGLASIVVLFAAVGLVCFGIFGFLVCCSDYSDATYRGGTSPEVLRRRRRTVQAMASVLVAVTAGLLVALTLLELTASSMADSVDDAAHRFNSVAREGRTLDADLGRTANLTATINTTEGSDARMAQDALIDGCTEGQSAVEGLVSEHSSIASNGTALDRVAHGFERWLRWGMGGMAGLIVAPALLFLVGAASRTSALVRASGYLFVLALPLAFLVSGVEYMAAVSVSDFCVAPDAATMRFLESELHDSPAAHAYYVACAPGSVSPFAADLGNATVALNRSAEAWEALDKLASNDSSAVPVLLEVSGLLEKMGGEVDDIAAGLDCPPYHDDYDSVVDGACVQGLDTLFSCAVLHLAAAVVIMLALPGVRFLAQVYRTKTTGEYAAINTNADAWSLGGGNGSTTAAEWFNTQMEATRPQAGYGSFNEDESVPWYREAAPGGDDRASPPPWYRGGSASTSSQRVEGGEGDAGE